MSGMLVPSTLVGRRESGPAEPPVLASTPPSMRSRRYAQRNLERIDLRGRVAKRLLELATTSWNAPPADGTVLDWGLPQADLAYLCGGTRANVSRVLSEFGRRGLI